jgi:hypothetical protein
MARSRLCRSCGDFHDLAAPWPEGCAAHFGQTSEEARFYVISDTMAPIRSMADGRMHDSKSVYRRELKARGCIEIGNERVERRHTPLPPIRDDLRRTYQQLKG